MNSPPNKKGDSTGDWYVKYRSGNPDWESQLTPEEEQAMIDEYNWAGRAGRYDWPGPVRVGVIDD